MCLFICLFVCFLAFSFFRGAAAIYSTLSLVLLSSSLLVTGAYVLSTLSVLSIDQISGPGIYVFVDVVGEDIGWVVGDKEGRAGFVDDDSFLELLMRKNGGGGGECQHWFLAMGMSLSQVEKKGRDVCEQPSGR